MENEVKATSSLRPGLIVLASALGAFLGTFNETFLNIALVPIMQDLSVNAGTVQWVITLNMLVAAVFVPIAGFLYRMISTRLLYLIAMGSIVLGSLVGMVADSFAVLLVARVLQAIGAGMIPVVGMNMTLAVAPQGRLGTYIGIVGAATTLGPCVSPVISGIVLTVMSWNMLFAVYGVLSLACFVYAAIVVKPIAELTHPKLDLCSTVLVSLALIGIMYGVSTVFSGSPLIALVTFAVGVVLLVLFVRRQLRIENPLIELRPFFTPAFTVGFVCVLLSLMSVFSMNIIMPTFMQESLGYTALHASVTLLPAVMCACLFSPLGGRCYDKIGIRFISPGGMGLLLVFEVALLVYIQTTSLAASALWIALLYAPVIIGAQFVIGPSQSFALSNLPRDLNSHGVVILSTGFQIAGCVGSSLFMGFYELGENLSLARGSVEAAASLDGFAMACALAIVVAVAGVVFGLVAGHYERKGAYGSEKTKQRAQAAEKGVVSSGGAVAAPSVEALDAVMRRDAYVAHDTDNLYDVLVYLADQRTSGVPVVGSDGRPVGFISSGDIVRYLTGDIGASPAYGIYSIWHDTDEYRRRMHALRKTNVMELAERRLVVAHHAEGMESVERVLARHSVKKVPVVDDEGVLVGVVSRSDLMRYFVQEGPEAHA